jgi:hypothetical protein
VAETERVAGAQLRTVGPDELLADQGQEGAPDDGPEALVRKLADGRRLEHAADHAASFGDGTLGRFELLEAGGEECADRDRDMNRGEVRFRPPGPVGSLDQEAVVDEHGEELLDVQRLPSAASWIRSTTGSGRAAPPERLAIQPAAGVIKQ